ncbi:group 1 glycosyl transferase [Effusibacillus lacus]|uniref:Group 1 glycosyl transferase n=1 Tax=Effusibacillus lacus TaxID=1348429 RepID=A0A292YSS8_9BACL|nr:group 1 glycosyl transferase [Effusibacillus lacus]
MQILLATYWPLPHIGGVSTYVDALRRQLEDLGHKVEILAQHPDLTKFYLLKRGTEISKLSLLQHVESEVLNKYRQLETVLTPWMARREIEKYICETAFREMGLDSYDIIHTQDILSTFSCARAKPPLTPLVATIHGCLATEWIVNGEIQVRTSLEQEYLAMEEFYGAMSADYLILPSRWLSSRLSAFQISHPQQHIIPYGLDPKTFQKRLQQTEPIPDETGKKIIACPARLVAIKGHTYLLKALSLLVQKRKDFVCWLIGDGIMRKDLEEQAFELGLYEYVKFLGDRMDVPALLSLADIVVLPSLQDNLPFAVIEAQTVGKPVVASKVGGIVELLEDGKNGMLVEPGNYRQLFEKMLLLLENRDLYRRQSEAARRQSQNDWRLGTMVERTLGVYHEAMENSLRRCAGSCLRFPQIPDPCYTEELKKKYDRLAKTGDIEVPPVADLFGQVKLKSTQATVSNAFVHLVDMSGIVLQTVSTDKRGEYSIRNLQPGNYALTCFAETYGSHSQKIWVPESSALKIDIEIPSDSA